MTSPLGSPPGSAPDDENKNDNTITNVDSSNSNHNADNPVILTGINRFFQHVIKLLHTEIKLKQNKTKT